jgi:hypothetical protein
MRIIPWSCMLGCSVVALSVAAISAETVHAQGAATNATAERCGVNFAKPAQRVFADPTGKGKWTEYRDERDTADINLDEGEVARTWAGMGGGTLVRIESQGEDFSIYTDYCFDKRGALARARFEVRTAWGWGFREEGPVKGGKIAAERNEFFDIQTNSNIAKPESANDIPEALKPQLYLEMVKLPFAKLLMPAKQAEKSK